MNRAELRRAKAIATPEPVLYLREDTASRLGMKPTDIVHPDFHGQYVFVNGKDQLLDLRAIQEEFKEKRRDIRSQNHPIVSVAPDGETPVLLVVDDQTEAEEVQDILGQKFERDEAQLRKTRKAGKTKATPHATEVMETDWIRHVNGMPQADQFSDLYKQALQDRMEKHRRNPVTDPARDPWKEAREKGLAETPIMVTVPDVSKTVTPASD